MSVAHAPNPFGEPLTREWLTELEVRTDFWNRNPQLQYIDAAAAREEVSAWGLLLAVTLHRLSHISPTVVLARRDGSSGDSLVGGTSLNLFGALVGDSGSGKSVIFREASEIMPPFSRPVADGTGQGIVKSFIETERVTKDEDGNPLGSPVYVTRFLRHSLTIHAPEIKTLNAEFERSGSKTDSMLRSLWVGETVGMTTGEKERRASLPANLSRICGLWGVQPTNATAILAGVADGTPQRWIWAPAEEFRRGARAPQRTQPPATVHFPMPVYSPGQNPFGVSGGQLPEVLLDNDPLPDPEWVLWSPQMQVDIKTLRAERDALRNRDPYAPVTPELVAAEHRLLMESHLILTRIKLAAGLGTLWGHTSPTDEDWELAGIQLEVSNHELAGVWMRTQEAEQEATKEAGRRRGLEAFYADESRSGEVKNEIERLADKLWQKLTSSPLTYDGCRASVPSTKRKLLKDIIELLENQGLLAIDSNKMYWALWKGTPLPQNMASQFGRA